MAEEKFTFKKVEADDKEMLEKVYRLRFEVYCHECGFIREEDYPSGLEIDEYDKNAVHFVAISADSEVVGTMRLILPGALPLPIETHCGLKFDPHQSGYTEVSRLVISKRIRRRKNDALYYEPQVEDKRGMDKNGVEFLRRSRPMAFGLYRAVYLESKRLGIDQWYCLMEDSLWLLLRIHGFVFECIGQQVDVYGLVKPYLGKLVVIEQEVKKNFPQFFDYFTAPLVQTNSNSRS